MVQHEHRSDAHMEIAMTLVELFVEEMDGLRPDPAHFVRQTFRRLFDGEMLEHAKQYIAEVGAQEKGR